jgi:hypothetical protein
MRVQTKRRLEQWQQRRRRINQSMRLSLPVLATGQKSQEISLFLSIETQSSA